MEDIERMEGLYTVRYIDEKTGRKTDLVNEKLRNCLLENFDGVTSKYLFPAVSFVGIQSTSHDLGISPRWIFPAIYQRKFILDWMIEELQVSIIDEV